MQDDASSSQRPSCGLAFVDPFIAVFPGTGFKEQSTGLHHHDQSGYFSICSNNVPPIWCELFAKHWQKQRTVYVREEDDFNVKKMVLETRAFWVPKEKPSELCLQKTIQTTKLSHINTCKASAQGLWLQTHLWNAFSEWLGLTKPFLSGEAQYSQTIYFRLNTHNCSKS